MHANAYSDLILSMNEDTACGRNALRLVSNATTIAFPEGSAVEAWNKLVAKFVRNTGMTLHIAHKTFYGATMKSFQDPVDYVEYLRQTRAELARMGASMTHNQFMVHVLTSLPPEYDTSVEILHRKFGATTDALTIDTMTEDILENTRR